MIGIILVSHSYKIAEGLMELINEMCSLESNEHVRVIPAGGTDDGRLGTSAVTIADKIEAISDYSDIFIFCDMGSAYLSAEMALDIVENVEAKTHIVNAPLIDGAFLASVQASAGFNAGEILQEIEKELPVKNNL